MQQRLSHPVADVESPPPPPILVPDDVIREILLLLPVKSLVQFRHVCKSWKLVISDPQFVKRHFCRSSANITHTQFLFQSKTHEGSFIRSHISLASIPALFSSSQNQNGNLYPMGNGYQLIGACNGLVSLIKLEFTPPHKISRTLCTWIHFWNPAMGLCSQVSPPLSVCKQQFQSVLSSHTFGFGCDRLNDIYKVVAVFYYRNHLAKCEESVVNIYDMGGSCWKNIQSFPTLPHELWRQCERPVQNGVYVNDTLNWIVIVDIDLFVIVSLDLGTEKHSQMSLPHLYFPLHAEDIHIPPILGVLKDTICVLHNVSNTSFVIWQMKEFGAHGSWTRLFEFSSGALVPITPSIKSIGFAFSENDEVLLMSCYQQLVYNLRDKTIKFRSRAHKYDFIYRWNVQNYIESLVLPC